jgi:hypothetical protein
MAELPPLKGVSFGSKVVVQTSIVNTPILSALSLTSNEFMQNSPQGTAIGNVLGLTGGSMLFLTNSNSGTVQLISGIIQVGQMAPPAPGAFNIQLMEVLEGAANSPNLTTISIIEVSALPTINTLPSIPGTPMVGMPITAIDATWNNVVTGTSYQWQTNGVNSTGAGATTLTYTPVSGDVGLTLTITVIATNSMGPSIPATSAPSAPVVASGTFNSTPYVILLAA